MSLPRIHMYNSNANQVIIPEDRSLKILIDCNGGTLTRLGAPGTTFGDYLDYVEKLAMGAYERRGRLKIAPPYGAWLRATYA